MYYANAPATPGNAVHAAAAALALLVINRREHFFTDTIMARSHQQLQSLSPVSCLRLAATKAVIVIHEGPLVLPPRVTLSCSTKHVHVCLS